MVDSLRDRQSLSRTTLEVGEARLTFQAQCDRRPERMVFVERRIAPDWLAIYWIAPQDGAPVVAGVKVVPYDESRREPWDGWPAGRVPAGGLRAAHFEALRTEQTLLAEREVIEWLTTHESHEALDEIFREFGFDPVSVRGPIRRPQRKTDREIARVAETYAAECKEGAPAPRQGTAKRLDLSHSAVSKYLALARDRGILTGKGQGRGGGELTPVGIDLLEG